MAHTIDREGNVVGSTSDSTLAGTNGLEYALEFMIDQYGVGAVCEAIGTICTEKSLHLLTNGDNPKSADIRYWKYCARMVEDIGGCIANYRRYVGSYLK